MKLPKPLQVEHCHPARRKHKMTTNQEQLNALSRAQIHCNLEVEHMLQSCVIADVEVL
jgi:hypothetical protein